MLTALADRESPSPADFSLSVHHALVGLLSIATGNRLGHTAVAAGCESFACGLLEAAASATEQPGVPVVLLHFDEPLPREYDTILETREDPLAIALRIEHPSRIADGADILMEPASPIDNERPSDSIALDFLRFFLGGADAAHSAGDRLGWRWSRDVSPA